MRLRRAGYATAWRQIAAAPPGCRVSPLHDEQEEGGLTLLLHLQQAPEIVNINAGECSAGFRGRKYGLSCPDLLALASLPAQPLQPAGRTLFTA
ncbi:MAG: hypothetical protein KA754_07495, partial [Corallincola sp.]|nr:hypothetical protein [Corallincola sp.]